MNCNLTLIARFVVGLTWLYEGLWLKLVQHNPEELRVMATVFQRAHLAPLDLLRGVGCVETLLALGVLAGWKPRLLAGVQVLLLVGMDGVGIALGKGSLADPLGLIVRNLPFLVCILLVGQYDSPVGAGKRASTPRASTPRAKRKTAAGE